MFEGTIAKEVARQLEEREQGALKEMFQEFLNRDFKNFLSEALDNFLAQGDTKWTSRFTEEELDDYWMYDLGNSLKVEVETSLGRLKSFIEDRAREDFVNNHEESFKEETLNYLKSDEFLQHVIDRINEKQVVK